MPIFRKWNGTDWEVVGGLGNPGSPQPPVGFSAHKNGVNQTAIPNSAHTKLTFSTTNYNIGNVYNASLSRFQPQTAGVYLVTASLRITAVFSNVLAIALWKNGVGSGSLFGDANGVGSYGGGAEVSRLIYLNGTTEYVEVSIYQASGTTKDVYGNVEYTSFQASLIPGSYPVGGLTAITKSVQAPSSPADGDLWLDESVQVQDQTNYIDVTNASSDYPLRRGETAVVNYSAATSVPLHIKTVEGEYEVTIKSDTTTITASTNATLNPNNATYTGLFSRRGVVDYVTTVASLNELSQNSLLLCGGLCRKVKLQISTDTASKHVLAHSVGQDTGNTFHLTAGLLWNDTTTIWSSLGTLTFPFAQSGTIIIRRIY